MKALMNMLAPEPEICAALKLTSVQAGRHHWHEEGEGKVGEWRSREMWVTLLRPPSDSGLPRLALVYARVTDVVLRRESLPDWERMAAVWRPGGRSDPLVYARPVDVDGDPMLPALGSLDVMTDAGPISPADRQINLFYRSEGLSLDLDISGGVAGHALIERCAIDALSRIGSENEAAQEIALRWTTIASSG